MATGSTNDTMGTAASTPASEMAKTVETAATECVFPTECTVAGWYAAYTRANHEKRVAEQLASRQVAHFLPLYESMRRWKDRRVRLDLPLFPGYVFVRIALRDRLQVLRVPGVVRLVEFNGRPCTLPDSEIEAVQTLLVRKAGLQPHPYMQIGRLVLVKSGALEGLEGMVIRRKNRSRFVISLDLIMRSVAVEIDEADLQVV